MSLLSQRRTFKDGNTPSITNPLPIPLRRFDDDQEPVWSASHSQRFVGRFDEGKKCVFVDQNIQTLITMGSFGRLVKDKPNELILGLCEAFFLSYALGCLNVTERDTTISDNLDTLWRRYASCYQDNENDNFCDRFATIYAVYHHFRSKGWVVRSGAQFGATYLLYKESPAHYHALYAVQVATTCLTTWNTLMSLYRVNESASKQLLIASVIIPDNITTRYPRCLEQLKVKTQLINRWSPKSHPISS